MSFLQNPVAMVCCESNLNIYPPWNRHQEPLKIKGWKIFTVISFWESLFLRANSWFQGMSPIQPGFKPSAAPSDLSGPAKVSLWPFNAVHRWMKRFWISQGFLAITDEKCSCRRFLLGRGSPMKPYSGPVMRSNSFGIFTSYWRSSLPFHPKVGVEFMSPEKKNIFPSSLSGVRLEAVIGSRSDR